MLYHVFYGVIQIIGVQLTVNHLQVSFKKIGHRTFVTKNDEKSLKLKCAACVQLLEGTIGDVYKNYTTYVFPALDP